MPGRHQQQKSIFITDEERKENAIRAGLLERMFEAGLPGPEARVLKALEMFARKSRSRVVQATWIEIAKNAEMSSSTARRAAAKLVSRSLLSLEPVVSKSGQQGNRFQISMMNVKDFLEPDETEECLITEDEPAPLSTVNTPPVHDEQPPCSQRTAPLPTVNMPYKETLKHFPPPPLTAEHAPANIGVQTDLATWEEVEVELISLGIGDPGPALDAAKRHGCHPDHLRAVIAVYLEYEDAWGPGGLRHRILNLLPDQDPADIATHWLDVSPDYKRRKEREKQARIQAAQDQEAADKDRKRAEQKAASEQREATYGPLLDAMSADEVHALAATVNKFFADRFRANVKTPDDLADALQTASYRGLLLLRLEAQTVSPKGSP